jgi:signal recognition particle receptor subunit beta
MAYVNFQRSYIRFKIVYYGPGLGGKTTNLEQLHDLAGGQVEMISLETEGDRTIFFDYLPLNLGRLGGIETVFKLYTVPGQVRYNRTRQMVLRDVDGVVFVADSQTAALEDNEESLANLRENLAADEVDLDELPLVFQYNKRDLDDVATIEELERRLNPGGRRWFAASAINGENVKQTLIDLAREVYEAAAARYSMLPNAPEVDAGPEPPPQRSGLDSWQAVSAPVAADQKVTVAPGRRGATGTLPPPSPTAPATGAALERFGERLLQELGELREVVQQIALGQLEPEALDDVRREIADLDGAVGDELERNRHYISALIETIGKVGEDIRGLRDEIQQDIRSEVDRYLSNYLLEVEQGLQQMPQPARAAQGERRDSQPLAVIRPTPIDE